MPSILDIKNCIQVPSCIKDSFIRNGSFDLLPNGDLKMYSGGFASVFPVMVGQEKWAFRCWHTDLGNVKNRMELISAELQKISLPYFCDFFYLDEGIVVDGKIYPTTRMRWIQGQTIKEYICTHPNKQVLNQLAERFLIMCQELHNHQIAHGDLQHGNIMVDKEGNLHLIDYDSMYVPSMNGQSDIIAGLKDYQHPNRHKNKVSSKKLDYFSELIIYISILAIAEDATLIQKYDVENSDRMLFSSADYKNLRQSGVYEDLVRLGGNLSLLLYILEEYLKKNEILDLEPFDELLDKLLLPPIIKDFKAIEGGIIYRNNKVTLSWEIENYTALLLNGNSINPDCSFTETLLANKKYDITVVNGLKKVTGTLYITVVDEPIISLKLLKNKIRKGKNESTYLKWDVKNATSIKLVYESVKEDILSSGKKKVSPFETTTYELWIVGLDNHTVFKRKVTLYVLAESNVEFVADKLYSYPHIPIRLSWKVQHAKSVELVGFGVVEAIADKILEPDSDISYILKVTDSFGCSVHQINIKMLPLPIIKSLMVPTPIVRHSTLVKVTPFNLQACVNLPLKLHTLLQLPTVIRPSFNELEVNKIGIPQFSLLNIKLRAKYWWTDLWNKITNQ